jgi:hypothetical protein
MCEAIVDGQLAAPVHGAMSSKLTMCAPVALGERPAHVALGERPAPVALGERPAAHRLLATARRLTLRTLQCRTREGCLCIGRGCE